MRRNVLAGLAFLLAGAGMAFGAEAPAVSPKPGARESARTEIITNLEQSLGSFGSLTTRGTMRAYTDRIEYVPSGFEKTVVPKIIRESNVVYQPTPNVTEIMPFRLWGNEETTTFTVEEDSRVVFEDTNGDGVLNLDDRVAGAVDSKTVFTATGKEGILDKVVYKAGGFTTTYGKEQITTSSTKDSSGSYQDFFTVMSGYYLGKELDNALEELKNGGKMIWHAPGKGFAFEVFSTKTNQSFFGTYSTGADGDSFALRAVPLNSNTPLSNLPQIERDRYSLIDLDKIPVGNLYYERLREFGDAVDEFRAESSRNRLSGIRDFYLPSKN